MLEDEHITRRARLRLNAWPRGWLKRSEAFPDRIAGRCVARISVGWEEVESRRCGRSIEPEPSVNKHWRANKQRFPHRELILS